jgi:hypothetical protein
MKLYAPTATSFEKCPAGNHLAVCIEVIDQGTQEETYAGETKNRRKIYIGWETPAELSDDGKPFRIGRSYTFSANEKAALRRDIESWLGKNLGEELQKGFSMQSLIGKGCFLNVVHEENNGRNYANIHSVAALPKGTTAPGATHETIYFSLDVDEYSPAVFEGLSPYMKEKISQSPEWAKLSNDSPF